MRTEREVRDEIASLTRKKAVIVDEREQHRNGPDHEFEIRTLQERIAFLNDTLGLTEAAVKAEIARINLEKQSLMDAWPATYGVNALWRDQGLVRLQLDVLHWVLGEERPKRNFDTWSMANATRV